VISTVVYFGLVIVQEGAPNVSVYVARGADTISVKD